MPGSARDFEHLQELLGAALDALARLPVALARCGLPWREADEIARAYGLLWTDVAERRLAMAMRAAIGRGVVQ